MDTNRVSRRMQLVLAGSGEGGKETSARLTYGNVSTTATDEQLRAAGESLGTLQAWTVKHVVKIETTVLGE